jgi:hypothetical protein
MFELRPLLPYPSYLFLLCVRLLVSAGLGDGLAVGATTLYMRSWWGFLSEQVMGNEGDGVRFHVVARPYEIGTDGEV